MLPEFVIRLVSGEMVSSSIDEIGKKKTSCSKSWSYIYQIYSHANEQKTDVCAIDTTTRNIAVSLRYIGAFEIYLQVPQTSCKRLCIFTSGFNRSNGPALWALKSHRAIQTNTWTNTMIPSDLICFVKIEKA